MTEGALTGLNHLSHEPEPANPKAKLICWHYSLKTLVKMNELRCQDQVFACPSCLSGAIT